jgi:predicted nucleotidyltransferase component of viral defense system
LVDSPLPDRYPTSFERINQWAQEQGVTGEEARRRFAQYAVLRAIVASVPLRKLLVFKGGNALDFALSPYRSTQDLDFSVDMSSLGDLELAAEELRKLFSAGLGVSQRELGVVMIVHSVKPQNPKEWQTFITYTVKIGYALPDDTKNKRRLESGAPSLTVVPIDISINEPICGDEQIKLPGTNIGLRVSTLEDMMAEKLRSWLQQEIRDRNRPQDLLDIAHILEHGPQVDIALVSQYLKEKAGARDVHVSKEDLKSAKPADRARVEYDEQLESTVHGDFIPFETALYRLHEFVDELDIEVQ